MSTLSRRACIALTLASTAAGCAPFRGLTDRSSSSRTKARAGRDPGSLNGLAEAKGLAFGTALGHGKSGAPVTGNARGDQRGDPFADDRLKALIVSQCGMIVPESALKWYALRPTPEGFDFSRADETVDFATKPDAADNFSPGWEKDWHRFLDDVAALDLDLAVTEFDVNDKMLPADLPARDRAVAGLGRAFLDQVLSRPRLRYVMAWGLVDKYSWLQNTSPRPDGLPKRPCPYDDAYEPTDLRAAMADAFRSAPARPPMKIV